MNITSNQSLPTQLKTGSKASSKPLGDSPAFPLDIIDLQGGSKGGFKPVNFAMMQKCCGGGCCGVGNGLGQGLRLLAEGQHVGTSRSRGKPQLTKQLPTAPKTTPGVAINLDFADDQGNNTSIHFNHGQSHLTPFTPGEDKLPGSVSVVYNDKMSGELNEKQLDGAIASLYERFSEPVSDQSATDFSDALNIAMALRYGGTSQEQVAAKHQEFVTSYSQAK